jgi:hypothetical protein
VYYVYHQDGDVQDTLTGESLHQNSDDYNNIDDFDFKKTVAAGRTKYLFSSISGLEK